MAVAWIGNRETLVERACEEAAMLLQSSWCPVFSFDTDIHGTRAAIALAERVGAAYDHVEGAALSREAALFSGNGALIVAPGEVRRRADLVAIVGELPAIYHGFVAGLADSVPDLTPTNAREIFLIGLESAKLSLGKRKVTQLSCKGVELAGLLAALRAQHAGRKVSAPVSNFGEFASALGTAKFPVFLFSGYGADGLALEMLQGLVVDINRKSRASSLHLPASESGWGSVLASTWMTGFPPRTGFGRGFPELDPWRFDPVRAIASGEADLHLWVSAGPARPASNNGVKLIALAKTTKPVAGAAVTIAIGEPGTDGDAVVFSARTGTIAAIRGQATSDRPSAATVIRMIAEHVSAEAPLPC
jgi:formylmethanofuran dehydrogenase subunit B